MGRKWGDYWGRYSYRMPSLSVDKQKIMLTLLLLTLVGLAIINVKTGNYVEILEQNKTSLEAQLIECKNNTENITSSLNSCTSSLNSCESDLTSKITALNTCESQKTNLDILYSDCKNDLNAIQDQFNICSSDLTTYKNSFNTCSNDLQTCRNNQNYCQDNYDALKANAARDYCCLKNLTSSTTQYYHLENNRIICTSNTADVAITC